MKGKDLEYCRKCRFIGWNKSVTKYEATCDYILIMHKRRPCPAGVGCTVRENGGRSETLKTRRQVPRYQ